MVERFFAFEDDDRIAKVLVSCQALQRMLLILLIEQPLLVISAKELVTVIYSQPEARIRIVSLRSCSACFHILTMSCSR